MTTFAMNGVTLCDALTNVLPHTSGDSTLPVLDAVQVAVAHDGLITFAATDRYTIGVVEAVSHHGRGLEPGTFLIPAAVARNIAKAAKSVRGDCTTITHDESGVITVALDTGETSTTRVELGEFPKWQSLWPTGDPEPFDRVGLGVSNLAKFAKLVDGGRLIKNASLKLTFYKGGEGRALKPVVVDVTGGYDLSMRALIMPVRLAEASK